MALIKKATSTKKVLPLDGDKLGMIGGMIGAIVLLTDAEALQESAPGPHPMKTEEAWQEVGSPRQGSTPARA